MGTSTKETAVQVGPKEVARLLREVVTELATLDALTQQLSTDVAWTDIMRPCAIAHRAIDLMRQDVDANVALALAAQAQFHLDRLLDQDEPVHLAGVFRGLEALAKHLDRPEGNISPREFRRLEVLRDDLAEFLVEIVPGGVGRAVS